MAPGAHILLPSATAGINRTLYFFKGDTLQVAETKLNAYHAAEVTPDQELLIKNGSQTSRLLLLQGKPINEQVVQHGPFVMNTDQEIEKAFEDY